MKTKNLFVLILLISVFSCKKNDEPISPLELLNGTYEGMFQREETVNNDIILFLDNGEFGGSSEGGMVPKICDGTYTASASEINFSPQCLAESGEDASLILSGVWSYELDEDELTLLKSNGDTYILTKVMGE